MVATPLEQHQATAPRLCDLISLLQPLLATGHIRLTTLPPSTPAHALIETPERRTAMGNCFSDPSHAKPPGKGQKLRSGPSAGASAGAGAGGGQRLGGGPGAAPATAQRYNDPPRTLGGPTSVNGSAGAGVAAGTGTGMSEEEQRDRMLRAAEERARAVRLCPPLSQTLAV